MNARRFRPAHERMRQHAADRRRAHVVEAVVFHGGAVPVADVRLVPDLPQPRVDLVRIAVSQVRGIDCHQLRPLVPVLRRVGPPGEDVALWKGVPIRLRMRGERLGHEADLDQWADVLGDEGIEDAIRNREVVDRRAVRFFGVKVRRSPLERTRAIAGCEEIVRAEIDRRRAERGELTQELFAVRRIGVVGFVGAKEIPDGLIRRDSAGGVNADGDRRVGRRGARERRRSRERGGDAQGNPTRGSRRSRHGVQSTASLLAILDSRPCRQDHDPGARLCLRIETQRAATQCAAARRNELSCWRSYSGFLSSGFLFLSSGLGAGFFSPGFGSPGFAGVPGLASSAFGGAGFASFCAGGAGLAAGFSAGAGAGLASGLLAGGAAGFASILAGGAPLPPGPAGTGLPSSADDLTTAFCVFAPVGAATGVRPAGGLGGGAAVGFFCNAAMDGRTVGAATGCIGALPTDASRVGLITLLMLGSTVACSICWGGTFTTTFEADRPDAKSLWFIAVTPTVRFT